MMRWVWLAASLAMTGCSASAPTAAADTGTATLDAAPATDAQVALDGSSIRDAGVELDAAEPNDASSVDTGPLADAGPINPFATQPDESEGLTNISADLEALLVRLDHIRE